MSASIIIEGKLPGSRKPLFPDIHLPYPPDYDSSRGKTTLREFLCKIVRQQVADFNQRQEAQTLLRAMSPDAIDEAASKGKVKPGGQTWQQRADEDEATGIALLAFEDGLYYVFIDGSQKIDLEEEIYVYPDSRVTLVRLVALSGGFRV